MEKIDKIIHKAIKGNKELTDFEKGYFDGWYETTFGKIKERKVGVKRNG